MIAPLGFAFAGGFCLAAAVGAARDGEALVAMVLLLFVAFDVAYAAYLQKRARL